MWGWGRPRRDLPPVNYAESDSDDPEDELALPADAFNTPLNSPQRPVNTREGSPQELAYPPLCDNVDEELEEVAVHLADIQQVEEDVEELSSLLEDTDIGLGSGTEKSEEVVAFRFQVAADKEVTAENMPNNQPAQPAAPAAPPAVNYDVENKEDGDLMNQLCNTNHPTLVKIHTSGAYYDERDKIDILDIGKVARNFPKLEELEVSECKIEISDVDQDFHFPCLQKLQLDVQIDDDSKKLLAANLPIFIDLNKCFSPRS